MNQERLYTLIQGAHVSEKTSALGEVGNQYAFRVVKDATGPEIKEAVEKIYEVGVVGVRTVNVKGKVKRTARGLRRSASWKKAYVRLEKGKEIDFS